MRGLFAPISPARLPFSHAAVKRPLCRVNPRGRRYGFFFLKRPVRASTALLGFGCDLSAAVLLPPKHPNFDLNISAARPPTSGTNLGSEVVPLIWKGTVKPLLHPPPVTLPRRSPRPPAAPPVELAAAD